MAPNKKLKTRLTDLRFGEQRGQESNTLDLREWQVGEPMPMSTATLDLRPTEENSNAQAQPVTTMPMRAPAKEGSLRSRIRESINQPTHAFRERVPKRRSRPQSKNTEGPVRQFFEAVPGVLPITPAPNVSRPASAGYSRARPREGNEPSSKDVRRMGRTLFIVVAIVLLASLLSRMTSSGESSIQQSAQEESATTPKPSEAPTAPDSDPGAEPPQDDPPALPATSQPSSPSPAASEPNNENGGTGGGTLDPKVCVTGPPGVLTETCTVVDPRLNDPASSFQLYQP